jgi:hypothetical protein
VSLPCPAGTVASPATGNAMRGGVQINPSGNMKWGQSMGCTPRSPSDSSNIKGLLR